MDLVAQNHSGVSSPFALPESDNGFDLGAAEGREAGHDGDADLDSAVSGGRGLVT